MPAGPDPQSLAARTRKWITVCEAGTGGRGVTGPFATASAAITANPRKARVTARHHRSKLECMREPIRKLTQCKKRAYESITGFPGTLRPRTSKKEGKDGKLVPRSRKPFSRSSVGAVRAHLFHAFIALAEGAVDEVASALDRAESLMKETGARGPTACRAGRSP